MTTALQFKAVSTPSGKRAYEALCAVRRNAIGEEVALCAPSIETLKQVWGEISENELIVANVQHVWIVRADG